MPDALGSEEPSWSWDLAGRPAHDGRGARIGRPPSPVWEAFLGILLRVDLSASWCQSWVLALPATSLSTGAPSYLVVAPMGSSPLLVDSSSQLSNLTGFALVFESGDLLPSPGPRHVDMHENPVSADPGQGLSPHRVVQCGKPSRRQERKAIHIVISAACPVCRHHSGPVAVPDCYPPIHLPHPELSAVPELMSLALGSPPWAAGPGEAWPPPLLLACPGLGPCATAAAHHVSTPFYFSIWFL